jgi:hypothetical protein
MCLIGYKKPPFTAAATSDGNLKTTAPFYAGMILIASCFFGSIEQAALQSDVVAASFTGVLIGMYLTVRLVDRYQRRSDLPVEFDELPDVPTQRLGLIDAL